MKILVTGNAGSGKTTFSKKLSKDIDIPLYDLDEFVWKERWVKTPVNERKKLIKEIVAKESWIIDGVSKYALDKADKVYFLDIPIYRCVINIVIRFIRNGLGTREGLPENCPEYIGFMKAINIALIFNKITRPWLISESSKEYFVLIKNYKELEKYLKISSIT